MKIILPVAGKGTRLRPHTFSKPKSLMSVAGKTVLSHIIESLLKINGAEFIFIVDDKGDVIKDFVNKKYDIDAEYVVQSEQLGPSHAVWLAKDFVKDGDDVLVVFNDTIAVTDYSKITEQCEDWDGMIYVCRTSDPQRFGIVDRDEDKSIKRIVEKPKEYIGDLAVVGAYYFKDGPAFMEACDEMIKKEQIERGEYYMNFPIYSLIKNGAKFRAKMVDLWLDCGKPETLLETNKGLLAMNCITKGVQFLNDSLIFPPVYIAESAIVRNSLIGPNVSIGEGVNVSDCKITNSIVDDGAILEGINLGDSIIGQNASALGNARRLNIGDHSVVDFRK